MSRRRAARPHPQLFPTTFDLRDLAPAIAESAALAELVHRKLAELPADERARASAVVAGELASRKAPAGVRFSVRGDVKVELYEGKAGASRLLAQEERKNLVVDVGLNYLRDYPFNSGTAFARMGWTAIGSGGAAPASGNTALASETARVAFVYAAGGTGVVTLTATFAAGTGTGTVAEAGVFNNAGAGMGSMFDRFLIGPYTKAAGNELVVTVTITFTAA
jgi:hypothetical protein